MPRFLPVFVLVLVCQFCYSQSYYEEILANYKSFLIATTEQKAGIPGVRSAIAAVEIETRNGNQGGIRSKQIALLNSIRAHALQYNDPDSKLYRDTVSLRSINDGFSICLEYLKNNAEWALSQPSLAAHVRDVVVMMRDEMPLKQIRKAKDLLKKHRFQGEEANGNVFSNELGMHYGCLERDSLLVIKCRNRIVLSFENFKVRSIRSDFSLCSDDGLVMYGSAGETLLEHIRQAYVLRGTPMAYSHDDTELIAEVLFNAWQWMARGINTVPFAVGDRYKQENSLARPDLRRYMQVLQTLYSEKNEQLAAFAKWQAGEVVPPLMRYWPAASTTVYHSPDVSYFLHTGAASTGEAFVLRNGMEYANLAPVIEEKFRPGATMFKGAKARSSNSPTGTVTNGSSGMVAMDITINDSTGRKHLTARKCWAIHEGVMVHLSGGASGNISNDVIVVINQTRLNGEVTVDQRVPLKPGSYTLNDLAWIYHNGLAYFTFPFYKTQLNVELAEKTGSWKSVGVSYGNTSVKEKLLTLKVNMGPLPDNVYTGFVIAPAVTEKMAISLAASQSWEVMRNNANCQGVYFKDGTAMVAFYTAQSFNHNNKITFDVSGPCLLLIENNKVYCSGLSGVSKDFRIQINNVVFHARPDANGSSSLLQAVE